MAQVRSDGEEHPNDIVSSRSLTTETMTSPLLLPTLPFDILPEILCRLPVKLLVQLRCLCKFFNSLISDPKFAKKHLQLSTKRHHLMLTSWNVSRGEFVRFDSPMPSVFSTSTVVTQTQLYPPNGQHWVNVVCSCDGILCGLNGSFYFLWNPSITKFKLLPHLGNWCKGHNFSISFGYDHFIDNYKVIALSEYNEVCINTTGTDYWRRIDDFPDDYHICGPGVFVSGNVNWLEMDGDVISLDLEKESYHQLFLPDFENENDSWTLRTLSVCRDCLCVSAASGMFLYVWIMMEYGNKESWTKLYTVPNMPDPDSHAYTALYISENDQLLLEIFEKQSGKMKLVVYDSKTGTLNIPEFQNIYDRICPNVYIESLISP